MDSDYFTFETGQEYRLVLDDLFLEIPVLECLVFSGFCEAKRNNEFEIDFDFYMFFDRDSKQLFYEETGSALTTCIHNFCVIYGLDNNDIENMAVIVKKAGDSLKADLLEQVNGDED